MKKILKSFFIFLAFLLSLSLTSCDFINVLFDQSENSAYKDKKETEDPTNPDDNGNTDKPKEDPKEETPVNKRSDVDYTQITIDYFLTDYKNQYSYLEFSKDETYSIEMTEAYKRFYNAALDVLKGNQNYTILTENGSSYFEIGKYESTNENLIKYQIVSVLLQVIRENPVFYFLAPSYSIGYSTTSSFYGSTTTYYATLVGDATYASASARSQMNQKIVTYAQNLINLDSVNNKTDYQIVELVNNNLKANLTYAYQADNKTPEDSPWAHSVIGLYLYQKGVCECYAKNFKLLCDLFKVDSMFVIGIGNGGAHAWNIVKINDSWYGIDVTWNDTTRDSFYLLGKEFNDSHLINSNVYGSNYQVAVPELSDNNYSRSSN